jgi:hypothetical protein
MKLSESIVSVLWTKRFIFFLNLMTLYAEDNRRIFLKSYKTKKKSPFFCRDIFVFVASTAIRRAESCKKRRNK